MMRDGCHMLGSGLINVIVETSKRSKMISIQRQVPAPDFDADHVVYS